jgi:hypothetical protein
MKRMFVRGLWGNELIHERKYNTNREMVEIYNNKYNEDFVVYVYGKENYELCTKIGHKCILIDDNPSPYDLIKHHYRHKLEILKIAMQDYDEIIFIDWDCIPQKKVPVDFWNIMGKREIIQANLTRYRASKANWREDKYARRLIPNAGFLYLRDKSLPDKIINYWGEIDQTFAASAEPPLAKLVDEITGGWKNLDTYWDLFEPDFCNVKGRSPYKSDKLKTKDICFIHYHGGRTKKPKDIDVNK